MAASILLQSLGHQRLLCGVPGTCVSTYVYMWHTLVASATAYAPATHTGNFRAWPRCAGPLCDGGVGLQTASSLGESSSPAAVEYGGITHVAVLVGDAAAARRFYTGVLGMAVDSESCEALGARGASAACVRVGEQTIQLLELPNPDPTDVDPEYSMSAPPQGYVAEGRPVHAGRDRHVAITLHDLAPLKASLEANEVPYTMSYSGRQALFTRDAYGNGWEFGPPVTYRGATRLFPPYLVPPQPAPGEAVGWGGIPHVGLLVADTPRAKAFYCDVLGMRDETDLRPVKLPFAGLFLRCGESQAQAPAQAPAQPPTSPNTSPGLSRNGSNEASAPPQHHLTRVFQQLLPPISNVSPA